MIGKFTGNNICACGFSIGFERIVMLLLERGYEIPSARSKESISDREEYAGRQASEYLEAGELRKEVQVHSHQHFYDEKK